MREDNDTIDFSQWEFSQTIWYVVPPLEMTIKIATILPVILFGVFGNSLLLYIIMRNRALRTPTNLLLGNMAAADLATLLFCPIIFLCRDFFQFYILGLIGCTLEGYFQGAFLITAVLNLCAVSYDRLTAIVLPMETRLTVRGAKIVMLLTWVAGFALSIPLALYRIYRERHWKNFVETFCTENTTILPMYWHVILTFIVWCPLAVMVICYSAIFWKLDRYEQKVLKRENPISVNYKKKVAKMLFIVVIIFVILRVPFTALVFIRNQLLRNNPVMNQIKGSFQILWYISHYLLYLNAAVNPLIYGLTNDNFRRTYHQTPFPCGCCGSKNSKKVKFDKSWSQPNPCWGFISSGFHADRTSHISKPNTSDDPGKFNRNGLLLFFMNRNQMNAVNKDTLSRTTKSTQLQTFTKYDGENMRQPIFTLRN